MVKTRKPRTKKAKPKYKAKSPAKTKADIISMIMTDTVEGDLYSRAQAERILNSVFDTIVKFTADGNRVFINNFGTFRCVSTKSRNVKTPNGDDMITEPRNKITFEPTKSFKKNINS